MYKNGGLVKKLKMLGYNESIPGNMLNVTFGGNMDGMIGDINIFSHFLEEDEQVKWTTCNTTKEGNLFSWDQQTISDIKINKSDDPETFAQIDTMEEKDKCMNDKENVIEFFYSGFITHSEAGLICQRLNSHFHLLPATDKELEILTIEMLRYKKQGNISFDTWGNIAWVDGVAKRDDKSLVKDFYPSEGYDWYDQSTGRDLILEESVKDTIWLEPHSYSYLPEICPALWSNPDFSFWTQQCTRKLPMDTVCKFEKPLTLKISGLCKSSPFDLDYNLAVP